MNISMPEMLTGNKLKSALEQRPYYDEDVIYESIATRLSRLSDIYGLYIPSQMSVEIYNKLYLALMHSIQKKNTKQAIIQQNENRKAILGREHNGIIGGSDSFTIIGVSGIGKSSAIERAIRLISENEVIYMSETVVIPFVTVQCPFDSSVKGLLLEILRQVDDDIGSHYYNNAVRARATTDMLNTEVLTEAYSKRMEMLHGFVSIDRKKIEKPRKHKQFKLHECDVSETVISDCVNIAKSTGLDLMVLLKTKITVEEIML